MSPPSPRQSGPGWRAGAPDGSRDAPEQGPSQCDRGGGETHARSAGSAPSPLTAHRHDSLRSAKRHDRDGPPSLHVLVSTNERRCNSQVRGAAAESRALLGAGGGVAGAPARTADTSRFMYLSGWWATDDRAAAGQVKIKRSLSNGCGLPTRTPQVQQATRTVREAHRGKKHGAGHVRTTARVPPRSPHTFSHGWRRHVAQGSRLHPNSIRVCTGEVQPREYFSASYEHLGCRRPAIKASIKASQAVLP